MDPMAAIKKRMGENNKHEQAVQYARVLEKISLNTNWYESKMKQTGKTADHKKFNSVAVEEIRLIR
jgi:hypothetical protein